VRLKVSPRRIMGQDARELEREFYNEQNADGGFFLG